MASLISHLTPADRKDLLEELNYLNMHEIKAFCNRHAIPYSIWIETQKNHFRRSSQIDRKGIILERMRRFLKSGKVSSATCIPLKIMTPAGAQKVVHPAVHPDSRLYFDSYHKNNTAMLALLKELTDGKFKDGAVARIVAREFWNKGVAPTYRIYAKAWLDALEEPQDHPEWAFLADRKKNKNSRDWKAWRTQKAGHAMSILNHIQQSQQLLQSKGLSHEAKNN